MNITAAGEQAQLAPNHAEYWAIRHSWGFIGVLDSPEIKSGIVNTILAADVEPHVMVFSSEQLFGLHTVLAARQQYLEAHTVSPNACPTSGTQYELSLADPLHRPNGCQCQAYELRLEVISSDDLSRKSLTTTCL